MIPEAPRRRVLIADDDDDVLRKLRDALPPKLGEFQLEFARTGVEALSLLAVYPFELALVDRYMRGSNDQSLSREILADHPWVPVAVLASRNEPGLDGDRCLAAAIPAVRKPLDLESLPDTVRRMVLCGSRGQLLSITLFSVLSLLEIERKTARIQVRCGGKRATVDVVKGDLWNARGPSGDGLPLLHEVLSWDGSVMSLEPLPRPGERVVYEPMQFVLMEAARLQDEMMEQRRAEAAKNGGAKHRANDGDDDSLAYLTELAEQRATGELLAYGAECDAQVHLRSGRVAWATSTHSDETFIDRLIEGGHSARELHETLHECRGTALPLVKTLVERRVVPRAAIERAFLAQFVTALKAMRSIRRKDSIFLQKKVEDAGAIEFELAALMKDLDAPPSNPPVTPTPAPGPSSSVRHSWFPATSSSSVPGTYVPGVGPLSHFVAERHRSSEGHSAQPEADQVLAALRESIERLPWARVVHGDGTHTDAGLAKGVETEELLDLYTPRMQRTTDQFAAVREAEGTLLARRVNDSRVVWTCAAPDDYSVTVLALTRSAPFGLGTSAPTIGRGASLQRVREGADVLRSLDGLERVFDRAASLLAVYVARHGAADCAGVRKANDAGDAHWRAVLAHWDEAIPEQAPGTKAPTGFATLDDAGWWFAVCPAEAPSLRVLLHFTAGTPQGIGWTLLAHVAQTLDLAG